MLLFPSSHLVPGVTVALGPWADPHAPETAGNFIVSNSSSALNVDVHHQNWYLEILTPFSCSIYTNPDRTCSCRVGKYECFEGDSDPRCAVDGMRKERNSASSHRLSGWVLSCPIWKDSRLEMTGLWFFSFFRFRTVPSHIMSTIFYENIWSKLM